MALDATLQQLATGKNFAAMTTLMPDGQPQTQIMWVHADGDHLIINTETGRQKFRNVEADPRVTITVFDAENPYLYAEARGRVVATETGVPAVDSINSLSQKYMGQDYPADTTQRVILTVQVDRVHLNGV